MEMADELEEGTADYLCRIVDVRDGLLIWQDAWVDAGTWWFGCCWSRCSVVCTLVSRWSNIGGLLDSGNLIDMSLI